jgi:hypothetical protein
MTCLFARGKIRATLSPPTGLGENILTVSSDLG